MVQKGVATVAAYTKPGGEYITLNDFGNHLQEVAGSTDVIKDCLLVP